MREFNNPAIVIGGTESGLGVIRNLGRNGIDVYIAVNEKDATVYSKYCKGYYVIPRITDDLNVLAAFLHKLKRRFTHTAVLFPTTDTAALNLAYLMNTLGDQYVAPLPDESVAEMLIRKKFFYRSLREQGVPHPITFFTEDDDIKDIGERIDFPVFVKPSISPLFFGEFRRKGFVAHSVCELHQYLELAHKSNLEVMIQEIVPGSAKDHYVINGFFDRNKRPVCLFARRRLRKWPLSFGSSTANISVPLSEVSHMKRSLLNYLSFLNFRGIFDAEFKVDQRDRVGKLLDVNPRSFGGGGINTTFATACGINIILTAYLDTLEKDWSESRTYEAGVYCFNLLIDLVAAGAMTIQGQLSVKEWLSQILSKNHFVVFARDDTKPFLMNGFYKVLATLNRARIKQLGTQIVEPL